jgi:REP element-mobilizing transposase RayT
MIALHLVIGAYGFWPPNDPRGSGSKSVRAQHLYDAGGPATTLASRRRSVAHVQHDIGKRVAIKDALKFPPVRFSGVQARAVGRGIADIAAKIDLTVHAFAIMPDHMHLVVARHRLDGDELTACLKRAGTRGLNNENLHPLAEFRRPNGTTPTPWGGHGWKVFLDTPDQVRQRIRYVEGNPEAAGLPRQRWAFVVPFVG